VLPDSEKLILQFFGIIEAVEDQELITIQEAAERFKISEAGIYTAIYRKRLPYQERYGRKLLSVADLEEYLRTVKPGRPKKQKQQQADA